MRINRWLAAALLCAAALWAQDRQANPPQAQDPQLQDRQANGAMVAHPPAALMARPVFAQHAPPPAPVPFASRQAALQANPGRPVDPRTINQLRTTAPVQQPAVRQAGPANTAPRPGFSGNPGGSPANPPRQFGNGGNPQNVPSGITNPRPLNLPANNNPVPRPVTPTIEARPPDTPNPPVPPKTEIANPRLVERPVAVPAEHPAQAARSKEKPAAKKPAPKKDEKKKEEK